MKEKKYSYKKAGVFSGFVIAFVVGLFLFSNMNSVITQEKDVRSWHVVAEWTPVDPLFAEADPGAGNGGILEIYYMNSTGTDDDARDENTTGTIEGWCDANNLGYCSADDTETDIAHSTNFELWVRVRGNSDQCKRDATWWDSDLRVRVTSADLSISADTSMTGHVSANNSDYTFLYVNFVLEGPYSLTKGETNEITAIKFEAYY